MKQTLTTSQIADALRADTSARWSYHGAHALAEYLESVEEDTGEEMELDVVAIRCDFSEYESFCEWAREHTGEKWEDEEAAEKLANDECATVLTFEGGVIVSND